MALFFAGESGAGKSTAIERAILASGVSPRGFLTRKACLPSGESVLMIASAEHGAFPPQEALSGAHIAARFLSGGIQAYPAAFDGVGADTLSGIRPGDRVIMDEIGFLEKDARLFQSRVLETLAFPARTVGVIKRLFAPFPPAKETGFGHGDSAEGRAAAFPLAVAQAEGVRVVPFAKEDRDAMEAMAKEYLRPRPLFEALGIGRGVTAIIGGGGKSTLLARLALELSELGRVVACTSAHMRPVANLPFYRDPSIEEVERAFSSSRAICTGTVDAAGKLFGPGLPIETLTALADYVLVEADGSKGLPLKAHAAHEPALPIVSCRVIAVVGSDGFFARIGDAAHRSELYAQKLGKDASDPVTPEDAARVVSGYASVDAVFINKVESARRFHDARAFAKACDLQVVIGSLFAKDPVIEIWRDKLCWW